MYHSAWFIPFISMVACTATEDSTNDALPPLPLKPMLIAEELSKTCMKRLGRIIFLIRF
jgi:hypothetical protein